LTVGGVSIRNGGKRIRGICQIAKENIGGDVYLRFLNGKKFSLEALRRLIRNVFSGTIKNINGALRTERDVFFIITVIATEID